MKGKIEKKKTFLQKIVLFIIKLSFFKMRILTAFGLFFFFAQINNFFQKMRENR